MYTEQYNKQFQCSGIQSSVSDPLCMSAWRQCL